MCHDVQHDSILYNVLYEHMIMSNACFIKQWQIM